MGAIRTVQREVYGIVYAEARGSGVQRGANLVLASLIILNVIAVILESVDRLRTEYGYWFEAFEGVSVAVFGVEYLLRLFSCTVNPRFAHPIKGRLRYALTPMAILDVVAIAPALLPGDAFLDLRFVRVLRLVRMMRVLKIARYSRSLQAFGNVFRAHSSDLGLITALLLLMLVVSAGLMYFAEHAAQPKVFSSIPASMWWSVVTLTTVGYGDIYPVTPWGKFIGAFIALLGIGFFALPAGILASGFSEELKRRGAEACPHCGGTGRRPTA